MLRAAGWVWGGVTTENVLIDVHGEAWVIDFDGGYTEGWEQPQQFGGETEVTAAGHGSYERTSYC